jgi:hypothetical protein
MAVSNRKPPRLLQSGLTERVYIVTAYDDKGDGRIVAKTKHDVTEEFAALVSAAKADAWAEGHRAALDGVFPLRPEDNPYAGGAA